MTNKIVHHMSIPYLFKQLLQHELLSTPFYHVLDYFRFYKFSSIKNETPVNIICTNICLQFRLCPQNRFLKVELLYQVYEQFKVFEMQWKFFII